MSEIKPNEKHCDGPVLFRYTWPGRDEAYTCLTHAIALKNIANAMGLPLQMIQLSFDEAEEHTCSQIVKDGEE